MLKYLKIPKENKYTVYYQIPKDLNIKRNYLVNFYLQFFFL